MAKHIAPKDTTGAATTLKAIFPAWADSDATVGIALEPISSVFNKYNETGVGLLQCTEYLIRTFTTVQKIEKQHRGTGATKAEPNSLIDLQHPYHLQQGRDVDYQPFYTAVDDCFPNAVGITALLHFSNSAECNADDMIAIEFVVTLWLRLRARQFRSTTTTTSSWPSDLTSMWVLQNRWARLADEILIGLVLGPNAIDVPVGTEPSSMWVTESYRVKHTIAAALGSVSKSFSYIVRAVVNLAWIEQSVDQVKWAWFAGIVLSGGGGNQLAGPWNGYVYHLLEVTGISAARGKVETVSDRYGLPTDKTLQSKLKKMVVAAMTKQNQHAPPANLALEERVLNWDDGYRTGWHG